MQTKLNDYDFDKNISFSNILNKAPGVWLENKKKIDNAEGLWRIYDGLYDVTDFINVHPGGKFWLEETRGADVTELFESHHVISDKPEKMLKGFFIRNAIGPRASKLTFDENGFYRTIKRRAREVLKTIPKSHQFYSKFYTDCVVLTTFILACLANYLSMYTIGFLAGLFASLCLVAAHNYYHQKDNWRMYYADAFWFPSRHARIFHVLSHHMYPNSTADLQFNIGSPLITLFPVSKHFVVKYLSWIYTPLMLWPLVFHITLLINALENYSMPNKHRIGTKLILALPVVMYIFGNKSIWATFLMWQFIILIHGFFSCCIGLALNHVHPDIYVEGDLTRSKEQLDWGINQLDTTQDRFEIAENQFLSLVAFGDHGLHHLFPTIDHGVLHKLYPVVEETLKEFGLNNIRMTNSADLLLGYFKRMKIEVANLHPSKLGYVKK